MAKRADDPLKHFARRHLRLGWWSLFASLTLGIVLALVGNVAILSWRRARPVHAGAVPLAKSPAA